jgi:hypothetical protein
MRLDVLKLHGIVTLTRSMFRRAFAQLPSCLHIKLEQRVSCCADPGM